MNQPLRILYFARLREALGTASEEIALPDGVGDVDGLMAWLAARGGVWQAEFSGSRPIRAAVNQALVQGTARIQGGDEVAFFPPVTGG
ncbi:MAG: molybdopterin converting factor subunit 1 [Methylophilaceae bacterium]|nr:molybdopterin converting factor subunit 1 [Methylophilaceae bacterium]